MSLACAVAPSVELLIGARALQGAFGALLVPSTLAIIMSRLPGGRARAPRSAWTAWSGISTVIGPLARRRARRRAVVALDLPDQRAARSSSSSSSRGDAAPAGRRSGARVDFLGAALCALGLGGVDLRADRAVAPRLGRSRRGDLGHRRRGRARRCSSLHERRAPRPDAAARAVPLAQLRDRQHRRRSRSTPASAARCSSSASTSSRWRATGARRRAPRSCRSPR